MEVDMTYYYWVVACNTYGCSGYSDYATGWRGEALFRSYIPLLTKGSG